MTPTNASDWNPLRSTKLNTSASYMSFQNTHTHTTMSSEPPAYNITASDLSDALFKTEGARAALVRSLVAALGAGAAGATPAQRDDFLEAFLGLQRTLARLVMKSAVFRLTQTQAVPGWRQAASNFATVSGARVSAMLEQLTKEDASTEGGITTMLTKTLGAERVKTLRLVAGVVDQEHWRRMLDAGALEAGNLWAFFDATTETTGTFLTNAGHAMVIGRCRAQAQRAPTPDNMITYFMAFVDAADAIECELDKGNKSIMEALTGRDKA